jgi:hypothetical protein
MKPGDSGKNGLLGKPRYGGAGMRGNNLLVVEGVSSMKRRGRPEREHLGVEGLPL